MVKKKYRLEYELKSSARILYEFLSTPNGLARWFSDNVSVINSLYTFSWGDERAEALLISMKENKSVKFTWLEDKDYFFELEILQDELTGDVALAVTDFATDDERTEKALIWNNQVNHLASVLGS